MMHADNTKLRQEMVEKALFARGVRSELVLNAMQTVPREKFLPERLREFAYDDAPLPIDEGQTISQPYIVAFMTEALALSGGERVLEIGTGSGYAAAILSQVAGKVYTVERIGQLAEKSASLLADLGYDNVHVLHGDGTKGWPDHAFGVVLLVSLCKRLDEQRYLDEAEWLVAEVTRVLGRRRGIRIGEASDRDGQYFHYLAMWMFALARLGDLKPEHRRRGIQLARDVHKAFVIPGRGVIWKMNEDLSGPYPGFGLGALDAFDGYVSYRLLDEHALAAEISEMRSFMDRDYASLSIDQDLGLGMMLWLAHFFPDEPWAKVQIPRALATLDRMWVDPPGYFCRSLQLRQVKFAFTNYGVSL
jgi:protein-L-isoaspartate(D-aspartate) O-methyltransferase